MGMAVDDVTSNGNAAREGPARPIGMGSNADVLGGRFHGLLDLLEGPGLQLANPFAADAVEPAQFLEGRRIVPQIALGENVVVAV